MEKTKDIEPFGKYKYVFFVVTSLLFTFLSVLILTFFGLQKDFNLILNKTFFYWGFSYPVPFVIYEAIKRKSRRI